MVVVALLTTSTINIFAQTTTKIAEDNTISPRLSYVTSENPPYPNKASDYTKYQSKTNGSERFDNAIALITVNTICAVLAVITKLASVKASVGSAVLSAFVGAGFSSSKNLYYTVTTYGHKTNSFEQKLVYTYYGTSARTQVLYTQTVYRTKVPM